MKRLILLIIGLILLIIIGVLCFKYVYVPKGQEFDIKFTNLQKTKKSNTTEEEKAELTSNGLETRTSFQKAGDSVDYTFDVINDGTIKAKLGFDPIKLKSDMYFKKHINYTITFIDGSEVKKGDELNPGETKTFKVHIEYTNKADLATIDSQFYESSIYLMYLQNR